MAEPSRVYDRDFDWAYAAPPEPPPEPPPGPPPPPGEVRPPGSGLASIIWRGLDINPGHLDDEFTAAVTRVTGWYGTPLLSGRDTERSLADGGTFGMKTIGPREITIEGAAAGPRAPLMAWRDQLAARAAERVPAQLSITDPWLGATMTAMVRAGTESFRHEFFGGRRAFRWEVVVTAADPLLYDTTWQQIVLTTVTAADAGRRYARVYDEHEPAYPGWRYGSLTPSGSAGYLRNAGNADAPVYALYEGDLTDSRLDDGGAYGILLAELETGEQILVPTATLAAEATGGAPRAAYVRPGSRPLMVPAFTTARWHLYAQGSGTVTLTWRSAWV